MISHAPASPCSPYFYPARRIAACNQALTAGTPEITPTASPSTLPTSTQAGFLVGVMDGNSVSSSPWRPPSLAEAQAGVGGEVPAGVSDQMEIYEHQAALRLPGGTKLESVWNNLAGNSSRIVTFGRNASKNIIWSQAESGPGFNEYPIAWYYDSNGALQVDLAQKFAVIPDSQDAQVVFAGEKPVLVKNIVTLANKRQFFLEYFDNQSGEWQLNPAVLQALAPEGYAAGQDEAGNWQALADGKPPLTFDLTKIIWLVDFPVALPPDSYTYDANGLHLKLADGQTLDITPDKIDGSLKSGATGTFLALGEAIVNPTEKDSRSVAAYYDGSQWIIPDASRNMRWTPEIMQIKGESIPAMLKVISQEGSATDIPSGLREVSFGPEGRIYPLAYGTIQYMGMSYLTLSQKITEKVTVFPGVRAKEATMYQVYLTFNYLANGRVRQLQVLSKGQIGIRKGSPVLTKSFINDFFKIGSRYFVYLEFFLDTSAFNRDKVLEADQKLCVDYGGINCHLSLSGWTDKFFQLCGAKKPTVQLRRTGNLRKRNEYIRYRQAITADKPLLSLIFPAE
jgi:hypothetical protein